MLQALLLVATILSCKFTLYNLQTPAYEFKNMIL